MSVVKNYPASPRATGTRQTTQEAQGTCFTQRQKGSCSNRVVGHLRIHIDMRPELLLRGNMQKSALAEKRSCPCKKLPWSLSSLSAAEYGDVHSLVRKRSGPAVWNRRDSVGYTPLHLAAQHNHVAATSLLLKLGANVNGEVVGGDETGATPLHRAAFSGATSTMRLLMEKQVCNLLARDSSFGDMKTPLHKAAAGGRFLAVQLLLEGLTERNQLSAALGAEDSMSRTALQVADEFFSNQEEERDSVARWDEIAGGAADWEKCRALLQAANREGQAAGFGQVPSEVENTKAKKLLPSPPEYLSTMDGCLDCESAGGSAGMCLTSSWQTAFEAALGNAVHLSLRKGQLRQDDKEKVDSVCQNAAPGTPERPQARSPAIHEELPQDILPETSGVTCMSCSQKTISLYRTHQGHLVCKLCKRQGVV